MSVVDGYGRSIWDGRASSDGGWYAQAREGCPHCGLVLKNLPPEANIYPHMTGACKEIKDEQEK